MATRTAVAPLPTRDLAPPSRLVALNDGKVVGFNADKRSIEHFPAWDDDDVDTCRNRVSSENLAG
jgi:hypothetical protein